jgi:hypothetical protein
MNHIVLAGPAVRAEDEMIQFIGQLESWASPIKIKLPQLKLNK